MKYPELETDEYLRCFSSVLLDDNSVINFIYKENFCIYRNVYRKCKTIDCSWFVFEV